MSQTKGKMLIECCDVKASGLHTLCNLVHYVPALFKKDSCFALHTTHLISIITVQLLV